MSTKRKPAQSGRLKAGKKLNGTNNNGITLGSQQVSHSQDDLFCGISATSRSGDSVDENFANSRLNDLAPGIVLPGVNSQTNPKMDTRQQPHRENMTTENGFLGLHHLTGSIPYHFRSACTAYLCKVFNQETPVPYEFGRNRYDRHYKIEPYNVTVSYDSTEDRSRKLHCGMASVNISGAALDTLTAAEMHLLCQNLFKRFCFRATRVDLFFDDMLKRISPEEVYGLAKIGNVSGFRKAHYEGGNIEIGKPDSADGSGTYFGKRGKNGGGKFLRHYDKELESNGDIKAFRWEFEASKDHAEAMFQQFSRIDNSVKSFTSSIGQYIGGCISFIDRQSKPKEKNLPRFDVLGFWQAILDELGSVKIRVKMKLSTIHTKIAWFKKCSLPSLTAIRAALGDSEFFELLLSELDKVKGKLSTKQRACVREYWQELAEFDSIPI